uniref:Palmitoyltransferase n=1 Tax=Noctiluca scintillans TaxID=2966 RepID=A0A7S1AFM5_NOCSC|mmetsp:Transcript_44222/g.117163  ORF Transcript_44222/g.117163 Transcript_44222/m.117163 type:complete len:362 (+) Transcript_44222:58-1143(+)
MDLIHRVRSALGYATGEEHHQVQKNKVYGDNRTFFRGRLISGPDVQTCAFTFLLVFAPSVVWHIEVGAFWGQRRVGIVFAFLGALLQLTSLLSLLVTAFSDPGIIPRQKEYDETYEPRTETYRSRPPPRYFDLLLRGHPHKLKYCTTCNIYRPPRCTHCSVCENCIERFDHHCPWIGNCIGKRNYWLFFTFVSSTGALTILVFATALAQLVILYEGQDDGDFGTVLLATMREAPLATGLALYCLASGWFTVGLGVYHGYLVCVNQTTYEQVKGVYHDGSSPFNRGVRGNCADILCGKVRPRYFEPATGRFLWPSPELSGPLPAKTADGATGLRLRVDQVSDVHDRHDQIPGTDGNGDIRSH